MTDAFGEIEAYLQQLGDASRARLSKRLRRVKRAMRDGRPQDKNLARLYEDARRAVQRRKARLDALPRPTYPQELPVSERREEIAAAIREHQVVVVAGETGSGKTTQLPKICLELGRGVDGLIGHTQPRRIAARSLATRIGEELRDNQAVGYKVRFTDTTSERAYIKVMTDGVLLAETVGDPDLLAYDTIILDEAHERSLNIDFLLGYLKRLLSRRPDLKLVITSATIDTQRFAEHFGEPGRPAPVIEVSGRTYPVEVKYAPPTEGELGRNLPRHVVEALGDLPRDNGDVLVFLPTERDILEIAKRLRREGSGAGGGDEVLPLYARLPVAEQQKVFKTSGRRRVVLATNVAETSLTVPGVRYVVDTGLARVSRYSARSKVQRLPVEAVSQASANQRAGRCGRVGPGVCVRLFSEEDFADREAYTVPEIQRSNLAGVILRMSALRLGEVEAFPFMEPPKSGAVRDGYQTLQELNALDEKRQLTEIGRKLARLPVDPRIGRMVLAGAEEGCLAEVLVIAAALEAQDPRVRPPGQEANADRAHGAFVVEGSDFLGYLSMWDWCHEQKSEFTRRKYERALQASFLAPLRVREWMDLHRQLRELAKDNGLKVQDRRDDEGVANAVHRALLAGLLSNVAKKGDGFLYDAAGGNKPVVWPGSVLFESKPKWLVASEMVETTRLYARTVAGVQPGWVERIGAHLLKRRYGEPSWNAETGHVEAMETVTLYGLAIVEGRRVHYGRVDAAEARKLFIHHALVEGDGRLKGGWKTHNDKLMQDARRYEAKLRRRDLVTDELKRFAFYEARVPADVCSRPGFEKWLKQEDGVEARLRMTVTDVLDTQVGDVSEAFPDSWAVGQARCKLRYVFDPEAKDDGVTATVKLGLLNQLDEGALEWVVPGWLEERVAAWLRAWPKRVRRGLPPMPEAVARLVGELKPGKGRVVEQLAGALTRWLGEPVSATEADALAVPAWLRVNLRVIDARGKTIGEGRDLSALRRELGAAMAGSLGETDDERWRRRGITKWDFGELPESVTAKQAGAVVTGYPALFVEGEDVGLCLRPFPEQAAKDHARGLRRLLLLQVKREVMWHVRNQPGMDGLALAFVAWGGKQALEAQLAERVVERAFLEDGKDVRSAEAFEATLDFGWNRIGPACEAVVKWVAEILKKRKKAHDAVARLKGPQIAYAEQDVTYQLHQLDAGGRWLVDVPYVWMVQYPRYYEAVCARLDKLTHGGQARDLAGARKVVPWVQKLAGVKEAEHAVAEAFRWAIEEYRVQCFAEHLGTAIAISDAKIADKWGQVANLVESS